MSTLYEGYGRPVLHIGQGREHAEFRLLYTYDACHSFTIEHIYVRYMMSMALGQCINQRLDIKAPFPSLVFFFFL